LSSWAFLLPFVDANDEHSDDYEYWMWCVFKHCWTQPMFNVHLHNMYSVFPNDQGQPALAIQLLTMHKSHIRDHVASLASAPGHYLQCNNKLEARLLAYKGSSHNGKRTGKERNMTMARSCSRDWALPQLLVTEEERAKLKSRTKHSRSSLSTNRSLTSRTSSKRRGPIQSCTLGSWTTLASALLASTFGRTM
jgi:hypothetical protein